ncbi:MAG TPA: CPBP family intramembrane glutamic endopeptidase [Candidatus Nitrosotenuis sp.]|nr:CPBP family intramembrane glutamic endopeptidase [Candidatus Nitrosotenuis sp.]
MDSPPPENSLPPETPQTPAEAAPAPASPPVPFAEFPEDLRGPWTGTDVLLFIGFAIGSQLVLEYVLINIFVNLGMVRADPVVIRVFSSSNALYVTIRQLAWSVVLLAFLFYLLRPRSRDGFWRTIGWRPASASAVPRASAYWVYLLCGVPLAIFIQFLSAMAQPEREVPMQVFFRDKQSVLLLTGMGILVAPLVEETLFRGFLYPVLARRWGPAGGVLLTGLLFGLLHAAQLWGAWVQIGLLMLVGFVFTAVRAWTKSVVPCYFLHLGYNAFLFVGFFIGTRGLQNLPVR